MQKLFHNESCAFTGEISKAYGGYLEVKKQKETKAFDLIFEKKTTFNAGFFFSMLLLRPRQES